MAAETIGHRLALIRTELREENPALMSKRLGLGRNTWKQLEKNANVPSGETLLKLSELGFNAGWVLTGLGSMYLTEKNPSFVPIEPELMARVTEMIMRTYKDVGAQLSPRDLGRLAMEQYAAIQRASEAPEDYEAQTALAGNRLKRLLNDEPLGTGKRLA